MLLLRELTLAGMLLAAALIIAELGLRALGVRPSVADSQLWWAMTRAQAQGSNVVAVLGSSRSLLGIDPAVLAEAFPGHRVLHLGIDGTNPYAVLRDLAGDASFSGLVVCDMEGKSILPAGQESSQAWVDFYRHDFPHSKYIEKRVNERVRVWLQSRFALLSPAFQLGSLVEHGPYRAYQHMRPDRFRPAAYRAHMDDASRERHRAARIARATRLLQAGAKDTPEAFRAALARDLAPLHEVLRARGGRLVMVRMPTTDVHWTLDENYAPRREFWDPIEPVSGVPTVHFRDYADLAGYDCPDTSHLDAEDAAPFTRALAQRIKGKLTP